VTSPRPFRRIAIVGTGLIGASLGLALSRASAKRGRPSIVGFDTDPRVLHAAARLGAIDVRARSPEDAVAGADLVLLATPLDAILKDLPKAVTAAKRGALLVEVGPVKAPTVAAAVRALKARDDVMFAASHPMAGRERSGPAAATADLFNARPFVIVVPPQPRHASAKRLAVALARRIGATPICLTAQAHDRLAAAYSALPQIASVALAVAAAHAAGPRACSIAGTGYRDATRLAVSPFDVWRSALISNGRHVLRSVRALERAVSTIRAALERGDIDTVERVFARARAARRRSIGD
jgi:prephenate dehydrogenase